MTEPMSSTPRTVPSVPTGGACVSFIRKSLTRIPGLYCSLTIRTRTDTSKVNKRYPGTDEKAFSLAKQQIGKWLFFAVLFCILFVDGKDWLQKKAASTATP